MFQATRAADNPSNDYDAAMAWNTSAPRATREAAVTDLFEMISNERSAIQEDLAAWEPIMRAGSTDYIVSRGVRFSIRSV